MNPEKEKRYHQLFEELISSMTSAAGFDREEFVGILKKICELFNLSKGVTEFYRSLSAEKAQDGEIMIDYDNGKGDTVVYFRRIVTPSMSVVKSTLYMPKDAEPLSEEENRCVDLIIRAMLSFISRNRLQNAVERLAFYDQAGYPNLNYFTRHLEKLNEKGLINGNTVIRFNLRHFSLINQEIGRPAGDIVIRNYFDLLKIVIADNGIICRIGGDNFIAVFKSSLLKFVLQVTDGFPIVYDKAEGKRIMVSAYVGVYVIPDDYVMDRPDDLLGKVFSAAQDAKQEKSGTVVYFTQNSVSEKENVKKIRRMFTSALENGEFHAFYQPKTDILTGELVGAEALCRWIKEDGSIVPPAEFIPVLEQNTDICRLDFYMLETVCRDIRRRLDEGKKAVRVSVNLSRKHLIDVDLLEHLLKIIDGCGVPHEYIEFELTETTTDVEFRDLKRVITGLREEGIRNTVDDFGTGYSSLNLIREIPWEVLKLDKCFIPTDEDSENSVTRLMCRHVISMAGAMGLECVAEGVETKRQIDFLKENNCRIVQGFYFDKPLPVDEFEKRLDRGFYDI